MPVINVDFRRVKAACRVKRLPYFLGKLVDLALETDVFISVVEKSITRELESDG